jgi:hypothetical protein
MEAKKADWSALGDTKARWLHLNTHWGWIPASPRHTARWGNSYPSMIPPGKAQQWQQLHFKYYQSIVQVELHNVSCLTSLLSPIWTQKWSTQGHVSVFKPHMLFSHCTSGESFLSLVGFTNILLSCLTSKLLLLMEPNSFWVEYYPARPCPQ